MKKDHTRLKRFVRNKCHNSFWNGFFFMPVAFMILMLLVALLADLYTKIFGK